MSRVDGRIQKLESRPEQKFKVQSLLFSAVHAFCRKHKQTLIKSDSFLLCVNIPYITSLLHHGYYIIHLLYMRYYTIEVVSSTGSKVIS